MVFPEFGSSNYLYLYLYLDKRPEVAVVYAASHVKSQMLYFLTKHSLVMQLMNSDCCLFALESFLLTTKKKTCVQVGRKMQSATVTDLKDQPIDVTGKEELHLQPQLRASEILKI